MRIGLLYMGKVPGKICGSAVITYYLAREMRNLGHEVWRVSPTEKVDWQELLSRPTDFIIAEGVPDHMIPEIVWQRCSCIIFWWLSELYYNKAAMLKSRFNAVATNSKEYAAWLGHNGISAACIELAAPRHFISIAPRAELSAICTYLGCYPHKSMEQLELLLRPASRVGLSIWGAGWNTSAFKAWHRGTLPLLEIGSLYKSVRVVLALTEERQKASGMVNNRIFEALASGAIVVSDPYPGLAQHELGGFVHFATSSESAHELVLRAVTDSQLKKRALIGQRAVMQRHTYERRAAEFLRFYLEARTGTPQ